MEFKDKPTLQTTPLKLIQKGLELKQNQFRRTGKFYFLLLPNVNDLEIMPLNWPNWKEKEKHTQFLKWEIKLFSLHTSTYSTSLNIKIFSRKKHSKCFSLPKAIRALAFWVVKKYPCYNLKNYLSNLFNNTQHFI